MGRRSGWIEAGALTLASTALAGCVGQEPAAPAPLARGARAEPRLARGERSLAQGEVDAAAAAFQEALALDPRCVRAHLLLAACHARRRDYALEVAEYRKAISVNPRSVEAWERLGHAALALDDLEQAREAYQRVLAHEPENPYALYNLGLVELDLGRAEDGRALFERFLEAEQAARERGGAGEAWDGRAERVRQRLRELAVDEAAGDT